MTPVQRGGWQCDHFEKNSVSIKRIFREFVVFYPENNSREY
jgi:hypothetical protein